MTAQEAKVALEKAKAEYTLPGHVIEILNSAIIYAINTRRDACRAKIPVFYGLPQAHADGFTIYDVHDFLVRSGYTYEGYTMEKQNTKDYVVVHFNF